MNQPPYNANIYIGIQSFDLLNKKTPSKGLTRVSLKIRNIRVDSKTILERYSDAGQYLRNDYVSSPTAP